jgi:hypothetical protein
MYPTLVEPCISVSLLYCVSYVFYLSICFILFLCAPVFITTGKETCSVVVYVCDYFILREDIVRERRGNYSRCDVGCIP